MKKLLSFALAVIITMSASTLGANAVLPDNSAPVEDGAVPMSHPVRYDSPAVNVSDTLMDSVDLAELRAYLFDKFYNGCSQIDVSKFNISYTKDNVDAITNFIWKEMPESFNVDSLGASPYGGIISSIVVTYQYDLKEYHEMYSEFVAAADSLLEGVKDNTVLTDFEKALILHDRLAIWNEYDYANLLAGSVPNDSYNAYGALVKRTSVCEGYSMAYIYLLDQIGIRCDYCGSSALRHAWNVVYIDGEPYYVDVTWDDPVWDVYGQVEHDNFLVSGEVLRQNHVADDYDSSPVSTRFDDYFWRGSNAEFQLIGDALYYIDRVSATMNKSYNGTVETLFTVNDRWPAGANSSWSGNFARLSSDGGDLLYSLSHALFRFDTSEGVNENIYEFDASFGDYFGIYGFTFDGEYLICELNDSPNYTANTKADNTVKLRYENGKIILPRGDLVCSVSDGEATIIEYTGTEGVVVIPSTFGVYPVTGIAEGVFRDCPEFSTVYYTGSEEDWANIVIGADNDPLTDATLVCNYDSLVHTHSFDLQDTDAKYQKSPATCASAAEYYYSCECGEHGTETFTYGEALGHTPGDWIIDTAAEVGVEGSKHRECTVCHEILETETIPALTDYKMVVSTVTAQAGETVTLSLELANTPALKSIALSDFTYDGSVLELVGGEWKRDDGILSNWNTDKGTGVIAFASNTDANGVIFEATFKVKDGAADGEYPVSCNITAKQRGTADETVVDIATVQGGVKVESSVRGDVDGDGVVTSDDAIYLLYYTLLPELYPISQGADFDGDGVVTSDDAIYLLYFTLLPELYPLN